MNSPKLLCLTIALLTAAPLAAWPAEADNGLVNPGFEEGLTGWRTLGSRASYGVAADAGRDRTTGLIYGRADAEPAKNDHVDQEIAIAEDGFYVAGAWVRSRGDLRPVLRIADMKWQTLAQAITGPDTSWQQISTVVELRNVPQIKLQIFGGALTEKRESAVGTSTIDDVFFRKATEEEIRRLHTCTVSVDPARKGAVVHRTFFGVNSLFMVEDDAALADPKLERLLRDLPCGLLRYPGGEMADNYHWKTHKLDDNAHWPKREGPDTTDTDEFMPWCRRIGAEPIFVVNLESAARAGTPEAGAREAAEWVAHCNREKNYQVRYWEIGNETYLPGTYHPMTARQYGKNFALYARAMKKVDPTIQLGAVGVFSATGVSRNEEQSTDPWWPTVVEEAGNLIDFVVVHKYHREDDYQSYRWKRLDVASPLVELKAYLKNKLGRDIPVALTEWNSWKSLPFSPMEHALLVAEMTGDYLETGVEMANFWPLRLSGSSSAFRALVEKETNEPRPPYFVLNLFASGVERNVVETATSTPQVYALATASDDGRRMAIFLVNKSRGPAGMATEIELPGFRAEEIVATSLGAQTTDPETVSQLQPISVDTEADRCRCVLPPRSITRLTLKRAK